MRDDLGRRLAELRRERRWTQAVAAEKLGMIVRDYQALEGGRRNVTVETVAKVAQTFGVTLAALFEAPASGVPRRRGRPPQDASGDRGPLSATPCTKARSLTHAALRAPAGVEFA